VITSLEENEVFVFGSNNQGFHGSGAAAMAFRYKPDIPWRRDPDVARAIYEGKKGHNTVGKWAVWGQGRGLMHGKNGMSYGR
jgi:hypothetical protein